MVAFTQILQALLNGLMTGSMIALPALGLTLVYSVLGFINFSVAGLATVGALVGYCANARLGLALVPCIFVTAAVTGVVGVVLDKVAIARLRSRRSPDAVLMVAIATIALNVVIENGARFISGNALRSFDLPLLRDLDIGGLRIDMQQFHNVLVSIAAVIAVWLFVRFTPFGRAMRAYADNLDLARLKGVSAARIVTLTIFTGAAIAGIGGMLLGMQTGVDPLTGSRIMLSIFAASVVGGLTSLPGAVLGAFVISIVVELALLVVSPTYGSAIGFVVILITLLLRPTGLMGRRA